MAYLALILLLFWGMGCVGKPKSIPPEFQKDTNQFTQGEIDYIWVHYNYPSRRHARLATKEKISESPYTVTYFRSPIWVPEIRKIVHQIFKTSRLYLKNSKTYRIKKSIGHFLGFRDSESEIVNFIIKLVLRMKDGRSETLYIDSDQRIHYGDLRLYASDTEFKKLTDLVKKSWGILRSTLKNKSKSVLPPDVACSTANMRLDVKGIIANFVTIHSPGNYSGLYSRIRRWPDGTDPEPVLKSPCDYRWDVLR